MEVLGVLDPERHTLIYVVFVFKIPNFLECIEFTFIVTSFAVIVTTVDRLKLTLRVARGHYSL